MTFIVILQMHLNSDLIFQDAENRLLLQTKLECFPQTKIDIKLRPEFDEFCV